MCIVYIHILRSLLYWMFSYLWFSAAHCSSIQDHRWRSSAWFAGEATAVYQLEVTSPGAWCRSSSLGLSTVSLWWRLTCEVWHHASGQFFLALHQWGHWSANDFLRVHGQPPSLQPIGYSPISSVWLTRHEQLNAWPASLLIVLNQEMWGIKMQKVSSCMPSGVLFVVRWSDEAQWKNPLMMAITGWFVCKMITCTVYMNIIVCTWSSIWYSTVSVVIWQHPILRSSKQCIFSTIYCMFILDPRNGPQAESDIFSLLLLHLKAGWEACKSGSPCTS